MGKKKPDLVIEIDGLNMNWMAIARKLKKAKTKAERDAIIAKAEAEEWKEMSPEEFDKLFKDI